MIEFQNPKIEEIAKELDRVYTRIGDNSLSIIDVIHIARDQINPGYTYANFSGRTTWQRGRARYKAKLTNGKILEFLQKYI